MNNGKTWLGGLVVAVIYFLLGGLFYGHLMKDWFAVQMPSMAAEPNLALIALACLAYGLLMAYTYPIGYRGGQATKEGMRFGILFALIVNVPSSLFMMAMSQCSWPGMMVSWIWEIVVGAVLGILLAKILGGSARAAAPAR